ncbi:hypothetical protein O181_061234 [Austropuccinia psidii MF-1]|uniref:Uncharacterized protein n=1 Tax=Austropuccinia psidii MF-1 TaxID=1389203 RepID=A0A9Q3EHR8_9BASI|nr:hypothetical protein [Austropuccinia psidii MF-1]
MSSSNSSSSSSDQSVWDLLEAIEAKLLDSIHQTSNVVWPKVVESSNDLIEKMDYLLHLIVDHSTQIKDNYLKNNHGDLLSSILSSNNPFHSKNLTHQNQNQALDLNSNQANLIFSSNKNLNLHSSFLKNLLKPRNLLITITFILTSRWTLNCLISSKHYHQFIQLHPNLRRSLPDFLKPKSKLSKLINRPRYSSGGSTRLEAIIILGADPGSAGYQIAIHLAQLGFIVIASVSKIEHVSILELEGLGWIKVLVLDPSTSQTRLFNRSLAASLSLRFPLNSVGDVFVSNINQPSLVGMINCLPICFADDLKPVECIDFEDELMSKINKIAGTSLEVVKVVLPMIRNSLEKFQSQDGLILTLFPTKTTSVSLPYISTSLIANQTLENLMTTLRREIMISNSNQKSLIRIINEKIGLFRPSTHFSPTPIHSPRPPTLPVHLHSIYAPSLSRRVAFLSLPTTNLPILSTNGSPLSHLICRVQTILQSPGITSGSAISIGNEVWKYSLIRSLVPNRAVEAWLKLVERMNGWVRQKVVSEVDLESQENLERVIGKRNFSTQSHWKANVFSGQMTTLEQTAFKEELATDSSEITPDVTSLETGSCIDKGEEQMQESFVGSEIDWKENQDGNGQIQGNSSIDQEATQNGDVTLTDQEASQPFDATMTQEVPQSPRTEALDKQAEESVV